MCELKIGEYTVQISASKPEITGDKDRTKDFLCEMQSALWNSAKYHEDRGLNVLANCDDEMWLSIYNYLKGIGFYENIS